MTTSIVASILVGFVLLNYWHRTFERLIQQDVCWGLVAIYSFPFVGFIPFFVFLGCEYLGGNFPHK